MSAAPAVVDIDDADGLLAADREGLLRAAASAGAQVRSTAASLDEGALEALTGAGRPRTVVWVAGRGAAQTAGAMLVAALGGASAEPIVTAAQIPPWIGPLDVVMVVGADPADPVLVDAAATGVRRGASVVVVAPYEGPLRDATAGRVAVLAPRLWIRDEFSLTRYLAAGLATLQTVDAGLRTDLAALADELDAEALRNGPAREVFTNPAKALAQRMAGRRVVLAGDTALTLALAWHGSATLLRVAHQAAAAAGLADVLVAMRDGLALSGRDPVAALFHDDDIDGPPPDAVRALALTLAAERSVVAARVSGYDDIDIVALEELTPGSAFAGPGRPEQQLALLAVRLEMAAVYLRLVRG